MMIDGEIYAVDAHPTCVFAYCERGRCNTSYYIGVFSSGNSVGISTFPTCIYGMAGDAGVHVATPEERERFESVLSMNGYKWNKANKVVIKYGGEIIKI